MPCRYQVQDLGIAEVVLGLGSLLYPLADCDPSHWAYPEYPSAYSAHRTSVWAWHNMLVMRLQH